jgi:hypothetical protein
MLPVVFCFIQQVRGFAYFFILSACAPRFFSKGMNGYPGGGRTCGKKHSLHSVACPQAM